jgi:uncharacterized protein (DUF1778 family)
MRLSMRRTSIIDAKTARLEARLTVVSSAQEAAARTVREQEVLTLSARDRQVFVNALLKPKPPGKRLRKAAKRYRSLTGI